MKKLIIAMMLISFCVLSTGCMSIYNHNRVKNNMIAQRVLASGNAEQIKAIKQGVKPEAAVKVIPVGTQGAAITVNLFDLEGIGAWWTTTKEAPISSVLSLAADGAATYYTVKALSDEFSGNDNKKDDTEVNLNNTSGETIVTIINTSGDGNTVSANNNADSENDNSSGQ